MVAQLVGYAKWLLLRSVPLCFAGVAGVMAAFDYNVLVVVCAVGSVYGQQQLVKAVKEAN